MNKKKVTEQILSLISTAEDALQARNDSYFDGNSGVLDQNLSRVKTAFSGSWLGYHANVYYAGFDPPTPGDGFSPEWGLMNNYHNAKNRDWVEVTDERVRVEVMKGVDSDYERKLGPNCEFSESGFRRRSQRYCISPSSAH